MPHSASFFSASHIPQIIRCSNSAIRIPQSILARVNTMSTRWFACVLLWVFHLSTSNHCLFSKYFIHRLLRLRV